MDTSPEWLMLLENGDVAGLRAAWKRLAPKAKQPADTYEAETTMHMARTSAELVSLKARIYSHKWLTERALPSKLPADILRMLNVELERPRISEVVGISVAFKSRVLRPAALEIQDAMAEAVNECYADGRTQVPFVRERMEQARHKTMKALFGRN